QNYVDGAWRYQVELNSVAEILVGAVIGVLAGANIRLALPRERADWLVSGGLIGAAVGVILALAQVALVVLAALLQEYDIDYEFLLKRFSGIIATSGLIGSITGLLNMGRSLGAPLPGAIVGAVIGVAFVLPGIIATALHISTSQESALSGADFILVFIIPHLVSLFVGAVSGAIVPAVVSSRTPALNSDTLISAGVILGAVVAVITSSLSFHYVILGLESPDSSFSPAIYAFRILVGLLFGSAAGLGAAYLGRRFVSSEAQSG
ncbi:MAG: hypothetical protein OXC95_10870, partial [Dehalococcoidia bacterium]|nr:hypothetical protein [Dehalococcoidia bacterium]